MPVGQRLIEHFVERCAGKSSSGLRLRLEHSARAFFFDTHRPPSASVAAIWPPFGGASADTLSFLVCVEQALLRRLSPGHRGLLDLNASDGCKRKSRHETGRSPLMVAWRQFRAVSRTVRRAAPPA